MERIFIILIFVFFFSIITYSLEKQVKNEVWDTPSLWQKGKDSKCSIKLDQTTDSQFGNVLKVSYEFNKSNGWVDLKKSIDTRFDKKRPLTFYLKTTSGNDLEIKFEDKNGAVFEKRFSLKDNYKEWTQIVIYLNNLEYFYGGKSKNFGELKVIGLAISGQDQLGEVFFSKICLGEPGLKPTFNPITSNIDPNRYLPGVGFEQRRAKELIPENPLVLEYLKQIQDISSSDKKLTPSMEDLEVSTFNNALVAMAFILKNERERAERILDFFANATDPDNTDITLQNFFYNGESRGFYQYCQMRDSGGIKAYHMIRQSDRWMGDMVWLLFAYKHYELTYKSDKYKRIQKLLLDLIKSYYIDVTKDSGYVQHGWRKGDKKLHEADGHHEGNVDCYALFMLYNEPILAKKVYNWLKNGIFNKPKTLPLDLYGWRIQAWGRKLAMTQRQVLDIPEFDLRFRKTITLSNGEKVMGFYHGADNKDNFWLDGMGHMAIAFYAAGDMQRGYFYANQYDKLLIDREINGVKTKALPYVVDNKDPNYKWVDTELGFNSVCAWYIFAKNKFNPMRLEQY